MKKQLLFTLVTILLFATVKAQYVTIPDPGFRIRLKWQFPSCFNAADQLDTTCTQILTTNALDISGSGPWTDSLDGIQYFKNLTSFTAGAMGLKKVSLFPKRLRTIVLQANQLVSLGALPDSLELLGVRYNQLTALPPLPHSLTVLDCMDNQLISLPPLPAGLLKLFGSNNHFTSLPAIPSTLSELWCDGNKLTSLPPLPPLDVLNVNYNLLTSLQSPLTVNELFCRNNYLTALPQLIQSRYPVINCEHNLITSLPPLSPQLSSLYCANNPLGAAGLPQLPDTLITLMCDSCNLYTLPKLPNSLNMLSAYGNNFNCMPYLPPILNTIYIDTNQTNCLPNLPQGLYIKHTRVDGSPFMSSYPICNITNNRNKCGGYPTIQGRVFYDLNKNGIKDAGENFGKYQKMSLSNGLFALTNDKGFYQMIVDTLGTYSLTATAPNYFNAVPASTTFNFNTYDTTVIRDIALQPLPPHDSVHVSITPFTRARPGFTFSYQINYANAGNTHLSATDVVVHYNALLLQFVSVSDSVVSHTGNTLALHIDSMTVGSIESFTANFIVSSAASIGTLLRAGAGMASGLNTSADTCVTVISGSYDPNDKDATPTLTPVQINSGSYIDYIIRFQNTGTDTAFHVVIADTLSNMLTSNTFQMVSSSHSCSVVLNDNVATFEMRNIMLPDSNVNAPASHGFIRFRLKPVATLNVGDVVPNNAFIYFDYNSPVVTNTASTQIMAQTLSLKLVSFKGRRIENGAINLQWQTNNEVNTKSFAIEQSPDSRAFSKIAEEKAIGYGNNNYTHNIVNPAKGNLYFRLKMFDKDGSFAYSPVILIQGISKAGFALQHNPVQNEIVLNSIATSLFWTEAELVNSTGAVVRRFTIHSHTQTIAVNDLPAGMYYIKTIQGNVKVIIGR